MNPAGSVILIAEDDPVTSRVLESMVGRLGHACEVAQSCEEAWERYLATRPRVLIASLALPGLDGARLSRRIREVADGPYCYVILLADRVDRHVVAGLRAGADDCLTKPLDALELEARLIAARRVGELHGRLAARETELEGARLPRFRQSRRDPLTGLGNSVRLQEDLAALDARMHRYGHSYCVSLCRLDRFQAYVDRAGDQAADSTLRAVAQILQEQCRSADFAYRCGTDEILVVLPNQTARTAGLAMERMRRAVEALAIPHPDNHPAGVVTISAGLAARSQAPTEPPGELLARSGASLREAERGGHNRVVLDEGGDPPTVDADRTAPPAGGVARHCSRPVRKSLATGR